jgi:hypothetical protein
VVLHQHRVPGDLTLARRSALNTAILVALVAGAIIFMLLLAGVGSSLLTDPKV